MSRPATSPFYRSLSKFTVGDGCWEWKASLGRDGYGQISNGAGNAPLSAHRVVYSGLVGPIPDGKQLDHLCRNPKCVRPDHLEPVTQAENIRRGLAGMNRVAECKNMTHCTNGHEFTEANTHIGKNMNGNPRRVCRKCRASTEARRRARLRGAPNVG